MLESYQKYNLGFNIGRLSFTITNLKGFNGAEKTYEVKAEGNHYDLGFRNYDPRLGRMMSRDPRAGEYPWQSPYAYHMNSPIYQIDYLGAGGEPGNDDDTADGDFTYKDGKGNEVTDTYREGRLTHANGVATDDGVGGVTVGQLKGFDQTYSGNGIYGVIDRTVRSVKESIPSYLIDASKTTVKGKANIPVDVGWQYNADNLIDGFSVNIPKVRVLDPSINYDAQTGEANLGFTRDWQYKKGEGFSYKYIYKVGAPFFQTKIQKVNNRLIIDFGLQEDMTLFQTTPMWQTLFLSISGKINAEFTMHLELEEK